MSDEDIDTEQTRRLASLSFLVIEDNEFAQNLAVGLLETIGAGKVRCAGNGLDALSELLVADTPPDVLLVDLGMPEMTGPEMMQQLAARDFSGALILVSGADEITLDVAGQLAAARGLNVLGQITKPLTRDSLSQALANLPAEPEPAS
ncbi:MAG: response regulator [Rhodospirillaceae bacterium]|nr:response regulator [Rhodospirillaceae bacterium]